MVAEKNTAEKNAIEEVMKKTGWTKDWTVTRIETHNGEVFVLT